MILLKKLNQKKINILFRPKKIHQQDETLKSIKKCELISK